MCASVEQTKDFILCGGDEGRGEGWGRGGLEGMREGLRSVEEGGRGGQGGLADREHGGLILVATSCCLRPALSLKRLPALGG